MMQCGPKREDGESTMKDYYENGCDETFPAQAAAHYFHKYSKIQKCISKSSAQLYNYKLIAIQLRKMQKICGVIS